MKLFPSEIEVRYVLPSLRKEISKRLYKNMPQKEIADLLDITPAAVNQYIKNKRGKENIPKPLEIHIDLLTNKILDKRRRERSYDKINMTIEFIKLLNVSRNCGYLCYLHKKYDNVSEKCDICLR